MKIAAGLAKVSVPLKADEVDFSSVLVPEPKPQPDVTLRIDAGGVPLKVTFKGKNFRKSMKAVIPGCFVVIQGRLAPGGEILDPGIVLQPPKPVLAPALAPAEAEAAA
jgi:hypothetical protein